MQTDKEHGQRFEYHRHFIEIQECDYKEVVSKDHEYGASWKKRGGCGAYMMLARKWDRIEEQVEHRSDFNVFAAIEQDDRPEGILDDIRDLRRYLLLVEAEMIQQTTPHKPHHTLDFWPKTDSNKHAFYEDK